MAYDCFGGKPMTEKTKYITVDEAARILNVHPETIRRLLQRGNLRGEKTLTGAWKVDYLDLLEVQKNYRP
jgi:excisionase family DNA binding protein